jgi:hypothetical protein
VVAGVVALSLGLVAAFLGRQWASESSAPSRPKAQNGLIPFHDKRNGLSISYPQTWQRIAPPDPEVSLVAGTAEVSMLMRIAKLPAAVGRKDLQRAQVLTDRLVAKGQNVKQLRPPRIIEDVGGLPGWLYIYSFQDPASKQPGAHAHYFLFRGKEMITLVFQTVPSESFAGYSRLFDRIAGTFKSS